MKKIVSLSDAVPADIAIIKELLAQSDFSNKTIDQLLELIDKHLTDTKDDLITKVLEKIGLNEEDEIKMKYREVVKLIEADGWYQARQKGSHRAYKHNLKKGIVTIAYHRLNNEVPPGTLNSILKQARLK